MKKLKELLKSPSLRLGSYSIAITLVVIAIAVAVNLLVGALPASATKLDNSRGLLFSLSPQTTQIVTGLTEDVSIYWIVQAGSEDDNLRYLLQRYTELSPHIRLTVVDPDQQPTFIQKYTISTLYNNSFIVESSARYRYVSYDQVYLYEQGYNSELPEDEAEGLLISFAGENALTSAIDYVMTEDLPKLYVLTGHGEVSLPATFAADVGYANIILADLHLLTAGGVPEDADCLMILGPTSDISEAERDQILAYLRRGGHMLMVTDPPLDAPLNNLEAVMAAYGAETVEGVVIEGNSDYHAYQYPYYLIPGMTAHPITNSLVSGGYQVLLPLAQGLSISDNLPDGREILSLLDTSNQAFSKPAAYDLTSYEKEAGDLDGPFSLALAITEPVEENRQTRIVWVSSHAIADTTANAYSSGANEDFFLNCLSWLCGSGKKDLAIRAKVMDSPRLIYRNTTATLLTILIVGVIPAVYFGTGIIISIRRKRR